MTQKPRWSIAGIRTPADAGHGCCVCRGIGAPAVVLMGPSRTTSHRICLPCVGVAVEGATGWKITRAWAQWLASSLDANNRRVGRYKDGGLDNPEEVS